MILFSFKIEWQVKKSPFHNTTQNLEERRKSHNYMFGFPKKKKKDIRKQIISERNETKLIAFSNMCPRTPTFNQLCGLAGDETTISEYIIYHNSMKINKQNFKYACVQLHGRYDMAYYRSNALVLAI
jgi:hypothetical protein